MLVLQPRTCACPWGIFERQVIERWTSSSASYFCSRLCSHGSQVKDVLFGGWTLLSGFFSGQGLIKDTKSNKKKSTMSTMHQKTIGPHGMIDADMSIPVGHADPCCIRTSYRNQLWRCMLVYIYPLNDQSLRLWKGPHSMRSTSWAPIRVLVCAWVAYQQNIIIQASEQKYKHILAESGQVALKGSR